MPGLEQGLSTPGGHVRKPRIMVNITVLQKQRSCFSFWLPAAATVDSVGLRVIRRCASTYAVLPRFIPVSDDQSVLPDIRCGIKRFRKIHL